VMFPGRLSVSIDCLAAAGTSNNVSKLLAERSPWFLMLSTARGRVMWNRRGCIDAISSGDKASLDSRDFDVKSWATIRSK
jgi:hypothetical protein